MVERRSPKPEVVGSSPSAPAKLRKSYEKSFKVYSRSKTRNFSNNVAYEKRYNDGSSNGVCISFSGCDFLFDFGPNFKVFIKSNFNY